MFEFYSLDRVSRSFSFHRNNRNVNLMEYVACFGVFLDLQGYYWLLEFHHRESENIFQYMKKTTALESVKMANATMALEDIPGMNCMGVN